MEIKKILKDKKGNFPIWAVVIALVLLITATAGFEFIRLQIIVLKTRDAVQAGITQVCTDNYNYLFNGLREGYSGGYKLSEASWADDVNAGNLYEQLDKQLHTKSSGAGHEKATNGTVEYRISDLRVDIKNTDFAPADTDNPSKFTGTATYILTVPLSFGWKSLPPMVINMKASGGYSQKGELTGTGGGELPDKEANAVKMNETALTLTKGAIETLTATATPEDANTSLSWTATNPEICSVDQTGTVTARNVGQSTIIAAAKNGSGIAMCDITVVSPVTGVSLNKSYLTLEKGASEMLTAAVTPEDATNKELLWASSDGSVCTVNQSGKVLAVNAGTSIVSATTKDGNFIDQCEVTVVISTAGISLNQTELTLVEETTETLIATITPENVTNPTVLWASSDDTVCTVDQIGRVTAVKRGISTVSVTTADGQHTAVCTVTVKPKTYCVTVNAEHGRVLGGGVHDAGSTVTLTAIPDPHYHFVNWTDSAGNVISWTPTYVIYNLSADVTITANFAIDMFTVTVNAGTGGKAAGGGTYPYGTVITLTATANSDYDFVEWSDGNTHAVRNYMVTENITLTAKFKQKVTFPTAPVSLKVSCSKSSVITVSWPASTQGTTSTQFRYNVYIDGVYVGSTTTTSYQFNYSGGQSYTLKTEYDNSDKYDKYTYKHSGAKRNYTLGVQGQNELGASAITSTAKTIGYQTDTTIETQKVGAIVYQVSLTEDCEYSKGIRKAGYLASCYGDDFYDLSDAKNWKDCCSYSVGDWGCFCYNGDRSNADYGYLMFGTVKSISRKTLTFTYTDIDTYYYVY